MWTRINRIGRCECCKSNTYTHICPLENGEASTSDACALKKSMVFGMWNRDDVVYFHNVLCAYTFIATLCDLFARICICDGYMTSIFRRNCQQQNIKK